MRQAGSLRCLSLSPTVPSNDFYDCARQVCLDEQLVGVFEPEIGENMKTFPELRSKVTSVSPSRSCCMFLSRFLQALANAVKVDFRDRITVGVLLMEIVDDLDDIADLRRALRRYVLDASSSHTSMTLRRSPVIGLAMSDFSPCWAKRRATPIVLFERTRRGSEILFPRHGAGRAAIGFRAARNSGSRSLCQHLLQ